MLLHLPSANKWPMEAPADRSSFKAAKSESRPPAEELAVNPCYFSPGSRYV